MKKKGVELGINFFVLLIISLIVFIFGVGFVYKLYSSTIDTQEGVDKGFEKMMEEVFCSSSLRVCIGTDTKRVGRGEFGVFTIKVVNVGESQAYTVIAEGASPPGYGAGDKPLDGTLSLVNPTKEKIIEKYEESLFEIAVEVPKSARSGKYIFNVKVLKENGEVYTPTHKFYVNVP